MIRWFMLAALLAAPLLAQPTAEIRAGFDALARAHPALVQITPLAEDRPGLYAAVLGPRKRARPAILILGSLRGDETAPAAACLRVAQSLVADEAGREMLARCEIIIIPTPNPDARDLRYGPRPHAVAGTLAPADDDRDGRVDEDSPADINGDGLITQMRVRRAGGRYVASTHDARVLKPAGPGEVGAYDLYWEGVDDDGDGRINEDPRGNITLSNDWSIRWDDRQPGAAAFMMQLPETRALAEFIAARRNMSAAFQVRGFGDGVKFAEGPPGRGDDFARDKEMQAALAKLWPEVKPGIALPPEGAGNVLDWLYESQGVHAATLPLATLAAPKPAEGETGEGPKAPKPTAEESAELVWLARAPGDWVEWRAFNHPQLGEVEIGGWKSTARIDPAGDETAAGADRIASFLKSLASRMPRLEFSKVEVEDKGAGLYRVRATLHNAGGLDYRTAFSARHEIHLPLFIAPAEGLELVSGTRRHTLENLQTGATATFEWLLRLKGADAALEFALESQRTGNITHRVALKDCPRIREEE